MRLEEDLREPAGPEPEANGYATDGVPEMQGASAGNRL
jgi:hypothetical protein